MRTGGATHEQERKEVQRGSNHQRHAQTNTTQEQHSPKFVPRWIKVRNDVARLRRHKVDVFYVLKKLAAIGPTPCGRIHTFCILRGWVAADYLTMFGGVLQRT